MVVGVIGDFTKDILAKLLALNQIPASSTSLCKPNVGVIW